MESGKPTLHYFFLYARAEPIRMALWKAGVEFNDNKVTGESWAALKASGKLPFGQIPVLEFADGTVLSQQNVIESYIGEKYGLVPADLFENAKAREWTSHTTNDMFPKVYAHMWSKAETRNDDLKKAA